MKSGLPKECGIKNPHFSTFILKEPTPDEDCIHTEGNIYRPRTLW